MTLVAIILPEMRQPHVCALLLHFLLECLLAIAIMPLLSAFVAELCSASAFCGGCQHKTQHLVIKILDH